ncbi:hypothetical protein F5887DRAFT_1076842 [Amanita rubescens]|nr:hypothetical protein F5887DRAFT_1076842 [Amanita rubescens]
MQGMQDVYDIIGASSRIEQIASERSQFRRAGIQLAELTKRPDWTTSYRIYQSNNASGTRHIVHAKKDLELIDPAEIEEVVISLQGVLWKHDLPPFSQKVVMRSPNRIRFLRQSVTLTGFGTPTFEHGIKSLMEVHALFGRYLPENKLGECTAIDKCNNKFLGIHLSNRYFTTLHDAPDAPHIPFAEGIDPYGYLADLAKGPYFHSEQNVVKYNNRYIDPKGIIKYEEIPPVRFRVGDIVEAKATLMVIPLKGGEFKLIAVLRSLTLWDAQFTQIAQLAMHSRIKKLMMPTSSPLKRNIGYDEDDAEAEVEQNKHKNTETGQSNAQEADVIMQENDQPV